MRELHATAVVDEQGELQLRLRTDLRPGAHQLTLLIDEQPLPATNGKHGELPLLSVGGVLPAFSLHRKDIYRDLGR